MRRAFVGLGFVLAAAFGVSLFQTRGAGQPAAVVADAGQKRITVTGTATVAVRADTARVSVAVRAVGDDMKAAVAECDKVGGEVEKALNALKLGGLQIRKGPINLVGIGGPGAGFGGAPVQPGIGFAGGGAPPAMGGFAGGGDVEVTRTYTAVATFGPGGAGGPADLAPVSDRILLAAVGAGATEPPGFNSRNGGAFCGFGGGDIHNGENTRIEFHRSNWPQLRQEALKLAVADAVANAKAAAGAANLTAKDIVSVTELTGGATAGVPKATGRGEVLGEQELVVQVTVTFGY